MEIEGGRREEGGNARGQRISKTSLMAVVAFLFFSLSFYFFFFSSQFKELS